MIHGAGGGYDQGLMLGETLLGEGYRIIAPSRFGYLNELPADRSLNAQADAFVCLLDALAIERAIVVGFSAGGPSGLTFAHRHPERTTVLILGCAVSFTDGRGQVDARRVQRINRIIGNDFVYWALSRFAWRQLGALFGVTRKLQEKLTHEELDTLRTIIEVMSPLSLRLDGIFNDQAQHMPRSYPLNEISVPTLVFHAEDDTLVPPDHARHSAGGIHGAELIMVPDGGHFLMVQHAMIRAAIRDWLSDRGLPPES
ncbi:MAG: alpha/beta hydrolase [Paracoccaceae bacterium]|nr:alpha/beta hydrolase [Paracoccaceae bacterium]